MIGSKHVLALDLGTTTGFALNLGEKMISGSQSFKPQRFEGAGMRFVKFTKFLNQLKSANDIEIIYFEEVRRHMGVDAAHAYGGFLATLSAWCEDEEIPYQGIPVGTIKKHATGKGNAGKDEMINAARNLGYAPVDDNEADAIHILDYVLKQL